MSKGKRMFRQTIVIGTEAEFIWRVSTILSQYASVLWVITSPAAA